MFCNIYRHTITSNGTQSHWMLCCSLVWNQKQQTLLSLRASACLFWQRADLWVFAQSLWHTSRPGWAAMAYGAESPKSQAGWPCYLLRPQRLCLGMLRARVCLCVFCGFFVVCVCTVLIEQNKGITIGFTFSYRKQHIFEDNLEYPAPALCLSHSPNYFGFR